MRFYLVTFKHEGHEHAKKVEASDPGHAYAKILREHPGAEIVRGLQQRRFLGELIWMEYGPVSTARPEPLPREKREQTELELGDPRRFR